MSTTSGSDERQKSGGNTPRRSLPWTRRLMFGAIVVVAIYGIIELFSFCMLWAVFGESGGFQTVGTTGGGGETQIVEAGDRVAFIHPYFGIMHEPNSRPYSGHEDLHVTDYGFFDSGPPIHKREPGRVIVAVTGGSLAQEFSLEATGELQRLLRHSPELADKEFVFVRLAIAGFKQPQQLMALNYLLTLGAEFDMVINIDGFNEIALPAVENVPAGVAISFPRSWHSRILETYDVRVMRLVGQVTHLKAQRRSLADFVFGSWWLSHSPTAKLLWKVGDNSISSRILEHYATLNDLLPERMVGGVTGPDHEFADKREMFEYAADVWKRASWQMDRLCAFNNIEYYQFLQPNQYVPESKTIGPAEASVALSMSSRYRLPVVEGYPILREKGAELAADGVRFYDLTQIFSEHPEATYRDDCCHLNNRGNELLAHAVAERILAEREP